MCTVERKRSLSPITSAVPVTPNDVWCCSQEESPTTVTISPMNIGVEPADQIAAAVQRCSSVTVPEETAVIAVGTSKAPEPEPAVAESMRLARVLAPEAMLIADFPGDPWKWESGIAGSRTGATRALQTVFENVDPECYPSAVIARDSTDDQSTKPYLQHAQAAVRPLRIIPGKQLGTPAGKDWMTRPQSWNTLTHHIATPPTNQTGPDRLPVPSQAPTSRHGRRFWWQQRRGRGSKDQPPLR